MSKMYKCDRCGQIYEKPTVKGLTVSTDEAVFNVEYKPVDLCVKCTDSLYSWYNAYKEGKEAYRFIGDRLSESK